jgi:hypothetical protein
MTRLLKTSISVLSLEQLIGKHRLNVPKMYHYILQIAQLFMSSE